MKVSLSKLTTKALATFAERVINSSQSGRYRIVESSPLLAKVASEFAIYRQVYGKLVYSGKGRDVAQMDAARDASYSALKNYVKAAAKLSKFPGRADAAALSEVFKNYGDGITDMNYAEETAQLQKLFTELDRPENAQRMQALALAPDFAELKQQQQDFEAEYAVQAEANTDLRSLPSATAIRRRLETALRRYLDMLASMQDEEGWQKLYLEVSELAKGVNNAGTPGTPPQDGHEKN